MPDCAVIAFPPTVFVGGDFRRFDLLDDFANASIGAAQAIKNAGIANDAIVLVGFDFCCGEKEALTAGTEDATVAQFPAKMSELGVEVSATAVARRYQDLLDAYVVDRADAAEVAELGIPVTLAHTLMATLADREELARRVLGGADALAKATA